MPGLVTTPDESGFKSPSGGAVHSPGIYARAEDAATSSFKPKGGHPEMFNAHRQLPALLALGAWLVFAVSAPAAPAAAPWKKLSDRETRYLEMELAQIRKLQSHFDWIGNQPMAAGALAAAALASQGRPDSQQLREEAARWVTGVLDGCKKWHINECARGQLPLERLVLQYPEA